jgi:serine/threonine-protein kinase
MKKKSVLSILVVTVFLASVLLAACGGASTVSGSFAGRVDGSDAFIAVVVHANGEVTAYVCDGVAISEWFKGSVDGSSLDLTNASGAHLTADLSADSIYGTFALAGGSALNFTTNAVTEPAGLYRAEDTIDGVAYVGGWIVLPDGEERGLVSGGGKLQTATRGSGTLTPGWIDPISDP